MDNSEESGKAAPNGQASATATNAVLRPSDPVPQGIRRVNGIEFNDYGGRDITVKELVAGMADMGFQASAVGDAVRIINDMVRFYSDISRIKLMESIESVEGSRNGQEDHHLSWLHLKPHLIRPA